MSSTASARLLFDCLTWICSSHQLVALQLQQQQATDCTERLFEQSSLFPVKNPTNACRIEYSMYAAGVPLSNGKENR